MEDKELKQHKEIKMRILSEEEMDEVFGGQSSATVVPTLNTVNVTAPRLHSYGGGYWLGGNGGYSQYDESASSTGGSWYPCGRPDGSWCSIYNPETPKPALASHPKPEQIKCILDSAAEQGNDLRVDFRIAVVNSYGYHNESTGQLKLSQSQIAPPAGYKAINGLTVPTNTDNSNPYRGTSTIYAGGMDGTGGGNATYGSYYNSLGAEVNNYSLGPMSGLEEAVLTAAHEARHQYTSWNPSLLGGRNAEADARTYAIKALEKFRAGAGQNCR